ELKSEGLHRGRLDRLAGEEEPAHPPGEAGEEEGGRGKPGLAPEDAGIDGGEFAVRRRMRGDGVDRASHGGILDALGEETDEIMDMDPRHPLPSPSEPAAESGFEDGAHALQEALPTEDQPDARLDDAQAELRRPRRGGLPVAADPREEA